MALSKLQQAEEIEQQLLTKHGSFDLMIDWPAEDKQLYKKLVRLIGESLQESRGKQ